MATSATLAAFDQVPPSAPSMLLPRRQLAELPLPECCQRHQTRAQQPACVWHGMEQRQWVKDELARMKSDRPASLDWPLALPGWAVASCSAPHYWLQVAWLLRQLQVTQSDCIHAWTACIVVGSCVSVDPGPWGYLAPPVWGPGVTATHVTPRCFCFRGFGIVKITKHQRRDVVVNDATRGQPEACITCFRCMAPTGPRTIQPGCRQHAFTVHSGAPWCVQSPGEP